MRHMHLHVGVFALAYARDYISITVESVRITAKQVRVSVGNICSAYPQTGETQHWQYA